ncbi:MAG: hypothetical protein H7A37_10545 [Chlamydiales bacterium]|nr:hypothetical protein [Chlamydiia bacterium]MCP5508716.1 hypothetical protein [Chlamydiales bacterium]
MKLKITSLEERIVLDAAIAAAAADAVHNSDAQGEEASHRDNSSKDNKGDDHNNRHDNDNHDDNHHNPMDDESIIYVDQNANGNHDGSSWNNAYVSLQDALDKAAQTLGADKIWIAEGVYTPENIYAPNGVVGGLGGIATSNLTTFNLPDQVELFGGFKAGMTALNQRNPIAHETVLTGDLLGNDIDDPNDPNYDASRADNAWHVVLIGNDIEQSGATVVMDGLTIERGRAAGVGDGVYFTYNHDYGAGIYVNYDSDLTLNNVTLRNNLAVSDGGGIFSNNSDVLIKDSHIHDNTAYFRGGGYEGFSTFEAPNNPHTMIVEDTLFERNTSFFFGGAIVSEGTYPNEASKMIIKDSMFRDNFALEGGAVVVDSLDTFIDNTVFRDNVASVNAGALATTNVVNTLFGGPSPYRTTVTDSVFENNIAMGNLDDWNFMNAAISTFAPGLAINFSLGGGAVVNYMNGNLDIHDSLFRNNEALNGDGGAILSGNAVSTVFGNLVAAGVETNITDSVFINNKALNGNGGAIAAESLIGYVAPSRAANIINIQDSNFIRNSASDEGNRIWLQDVNATLNDNRVLGRVSGSDIYAANSVVNDISSSNAMDLEEELRLENSLHLLRDSDIILM